jgi:hypothetical protein
MMHALFVALVRVELVKATVWVVPYIAGLRLRFKLAWRIIAIMVLQYQCI